MKILHVCILLFFVGNSVAAGTGEYRISGSVTKKGGGPLAGVTVLLKGKMVSVVTKADGKFELVSPVAVRMNAPQTQMLLFSLQGNAVAFSRGAGNLCGNVSILSGNGRCIASKDFSDFNPATERLTLPRLASGYNIVRVSVNNSVYTCQIIQSGNELHLLHKHAGALSGGDFTLAGSAAAAVDTISATKQGFRDAVVPVTSYTLSDISIEMDSSVAGDEIAWGRKENPTAGLCPVGTLPGYNSLTADAKLPDPFKMLSGTRITKKSEWACRRQELYQQALHYLYGEKPIPAKGSVTGTVSSSKITVKVSEGAKGCSFDLSVNMNGASQPAPAIIVYGGFGGPPVPRGVASITFNAIETGGTSGPKSGPFYDCYGSDHPAGYLTAQAWQISRVLDVLEQHPEVIDPYRVGVTGCSRLGKGAFVAGVLDNRIALTMPFECGAGGTVALRLIKILDPTGEYAYNAIGGISRWLSEVQLRSFSTGNNARGDNTDRLPIDMHEMMGLIAPRGLYIMDNPNHSISWADENSAWVTGNVGKLIFEALGVGDHMTYESTSGSHCQWRSGYEASLQAMIDKFLLGKESVQTGKVHTEATNP
ncbi:MAG: hypothetical protein JW863_13315, partial [Chitinispirillaceae bacterium]|nr:hypothetical protein [Chitinispirillaceae bacterium]